MLFLLFIAAVGLFFGISYMGLIGAALSSIFLLCKGFISLVIFPFQMIGLLNKKICRPKYPISEYINDVSTPLIEKEFITSCIKCLGNTIYITPVEYNGNIIDCVTIGCDDLCDEPNYSEKRIAKDNPCYFKMKLDGQRFDFEESRKMDLADVSLNDIGIKPGSKIKIQFTKEGDIVVDAAVDKDDEAINGPIYDWYSSFTSLDMNCVSTTLFLLIMLVMFIITILVRHSGFLFFIGMLVVVPIYCAICKSKEELNS